MPVNFLIHADPKIEPSDSKVEKKQDVQPSPDVSGKEFVLAHELTHIAKGHSLITTAAVVAMTALNIFLWVQGIAASAYLSTYLTAVVVYISTRLLYNALARSHERQADAIAMDVLQTNKGAIAYYTQ